MKSLIFTIFLLGAACLNLLAQDTTYQEIDGVVVTASRTSSTFSDLARNVSVVDNGQIGLMPVQSVAELLEGTIGVDIRQRGVQGMQADISLRGGTYEQTLVLLDGIKISDPQTGHHNLNLPVSLHNIEKIEILKGPASRLYGPNAMTGVINLISKKPKHRNLYVKSSVGDFGLAEYLIGLDYPIGSSSHSFSFSRQLSTGYRDNTEFDLYNFVYTGRYLIPVGDISMTGGYTDKEFGAYKFYSDRYPDEWEATETRFLSASANLRFDDFKLTPKLFYRRHNDDFILFRDHPEWYRNLHQTDQYGLEFQADYTLSWSEIAVGTEMAEEKLASNSLGDHSRSRMGLYYEQKFNYKNWSIVPGAMLYKYSNNDWNIWPGLDIGYQLTDNLSSYFSIGRSFRMPTFTDLYYVSPANVGNPDLEPETAWSYEIGGRWRDDIITAGTSIFYRDGNNMIDWALPTGDSIWQATNIAETKTTGFELDFGFFPKSLCDCQPFRRIRLSYAWLDSERKTIDAASDNYESKYVLDHLRHQLSSEIVYEWVPQLVHSIMIKYHKRMTGEEYTLVDTRLSAVIGSYRMYAGITNLFDKQYSEIGTIPAPGRWFRAGISLTLFNSK